MTPAQLREARATLGLTQPQMAEKLARALRTYQHLEGGTRVKRNGGHVPKAVAARVEAMLKESEEAAA